LYCSDAVTLCEKQCYITPKFFYPHEFQVNGEISILQTKSCDNLTDLFTKSLSYYTFSKYVAGIGTHRLRDLHDLGEGFMKKPSEN
jgi:hypothetical protein